LPEVSMTCSRVAIINRGRIVAINRPDRLMEELSGGTGYELEIEGELLTAQERLQYLAGVQTVTALTVEGLPPNRYRLRVISNPGADPGRDIAATLINAGLGLYEMRRVQANLEQVFLELTMADAPANPESSLPAEPQDPSPSQEEAA